MGRDIVMKKHEIPVKEIETLLDYNWKDEQADYDMNYDEDGGQNHIFTVMKKIDEWLALIREE